MYKYGSSPMTQVSVGVNLDGKQTQIPLIIPQSTPQELQQIHQVAHGTKPSMQLIQKAIKFALQRIKAGKSPFYNGAKQDQVLRSVPIFGPNSKLKSKGLTIDQKIRQSWGHRYNPTTGKMNGQPKHTGWKGVIE